jgi:hypothetical protein
VRWIDEGFQRAPGHYLLQTLMAFLVVAVLVTVLGVLTHGVIVAALGASTFIVLPCRPETRHGPAVSSGGMRCACHLDCYAPSRYGWGGLPPA